jgi:uncharacterized membrane protein YphA (DoxX/SURF4 family)
MAIVRLIARSAFAATFLTGGYSALTEPGRRPELVSNALPVPQPELLVRLNGAGMVAGGAALALGVKPRVAAAGLAAMLFPTTYVGHQFWAQDDPALRRNHLIHFTKNVSLIGGLVTYALSKDG